MTSLLCSSQERWASPARHARINSEEGLSRPALMESKRLAKCLLAYLKSHKDQVDALFSLFTIFLVGGRGWQGWVGRQAVVLLGVLFVGEPQLQLLWCRVHMWIT